MICRPGNVLLSQGIHPSTIGAEELNFRVRDGNGCDLFAIITRLGRIIPSKLDNNVSFRNAIVFG